MYKTNALPVSNFCQFARILVYLQRETTRTTKERKSTFRKHISNIT